MPGQADSNNTTMSFRLPRELHWKIKRKAELLGIDISAYARMILNESTIDVELSYEDILTIAKEVRNAQTKK